MDLDQLIRGIGSQLKGVAGAAQQDPLARYTRVMFSHASRWAMFAATGMRCAIHRRVGGRVSVCGGSAIGQCVVCQLPTCLEHSMVSPRDGTLICFACVGRAAERNSRGQDAEPQSAAEAAAGAGDWWGIPPDASRETEDGRRTHYLGVLGLSEGASDEAIKAAYRRLAKERHPDRAQGEAAKQRAERQMRELNEAYGWLMSHRRAA